MEQREEVSIGVDVQVPIILNAWLRLLAEAIVNGIFAPHSSTYAPPHLPDTLMSVRFWHALHNGWCRIRKIFRWP